MVPSVLNHHQTTADGSPQNAASQSVRSNKKVSPSLPRRRVAAPVRVVIENITPNVDEGRFPVKRVVGERLDIAADVFADGHDVVAAIVRWRPMTAKTYVLLPMTFLENDRFTASFVIETDCDHEFFIQGWVDEYATWRRALEKKLAAGAVAAADWLVGVALLEETAQRLHGKEKTSLLKAAQSLKRSRKLEKKLAVLQDETVARIMRFNPDPLRIADSDLMIHIHVERPKALFSSWYEFFPRSCSDQPGRHGTFRDAIKRLPYIARMGFDVVYLPPVHPIGLTHRKGRNNTLTASPDDPGSPWAIGSEHGGHKAVHPQLGTLDDFRFFVRKAEDLGLEVAMDLAFQCSPDHPYVKEHPQWFRWRPDGTIQYAENPPKKYEDIIPFDFETPNWRALWEELKSIVLFWNKMGIKIFRVDNPHTKPFAFWQWLIREVKKVDPDCLFLSEAFTRPKVMNRLAKLGFSQSYTYFTWRTSKHELQSYVTELTAAPMRDFFRPNFWPNTPDILPYHLQYGGRPMFIIRLVLAATLSSNYGIYGPAFELCEAQAVAGKEEYHDSEKYRLVSWNLDEPHHLGDVIRCLNQIRRRKRALQTTFNIEFCEIHNEALMAYVKYDPDEERGDSLIIVVNLDPHNTQSGWVRLPLTRLGLAQDEPFRVRDCITDDVYHWRGEWNFVSLNPWMFPAHLFEILR